MEPLCHFFFIIRLKVEVQKKKLYSLHVLKLVLKYQSAIFLFILEFSIRFQGFWSDFKDFRSDFIDFKYFRSDLKDLKPDFRSNF